MTDDTRLNTRLDSARRERELAGLAGGVYDVLVVGLGITGAGVALDAASRGLRVAAIDAHDLAFGTSRWSSKLAHGGLRYLASGKVGIAHESAVERGILMTSTAPHLARPRQWVMPRYDGDPRGVAQTTMAGLVSGDLLRRAARTPRALLPHPRRVGSTEALDLVPGLRRSGLRGAAVGWDGQLEDDARLVVAVARTAAGHGASILTRVRALQVGDDGARVRDELTGTTYDVRARTVVNATGVWAAELTPGLRLRPSRGTHLIVPSERLGDPRAIVNAAIPGKFARFVFAVPAPDGRCFVGLTDEPNLGPVPSVPRATESEIDFLLDTIGNVLADPLTRDDVLGTFAGLRPLLDTGTGSTADLSRRHAVLTRGRVITVVGGKLTTYRRMAQDAVDAVLRAGDLSAGPCRTTRLPLVGAADQDRLAAMGAPERLVRRYGTEAERVAGYGDASEAIAPGIPTTHAELDFAITHEGALDLGDLLDRRTRIGLVAADRNMAMPAALEAFERAGIVPADSPQPGQPAETSTSMLPRVALE